MVVYVSKDEASSRGLTSRGYYYYNYSQSNKGILGSFIGLNNLDPNVKHIRVEAVEKADRDTLKFNENQRLLDAGTKLHQDIYKNLIFPSNKKDFEINLQSNWERPLWLNNYKLGVNPYNKDVSILGIISKSDSIKDMSDFLTQYKQKFGFQLIFPNIIVTNIEEFRLIDKASENEKLLLIL